LEAFIGVGGEAAAIKYATEQAKMYKRKKKTKTGSCSNLFAGLLATSEWFAPLFI
jgi:hypothetical protein